VRDDLGVACAMKMVAAVFELSPQIGAVGQVRVGDGVDGAFFVGRNDPGGRALAPEPALSEPDADATYIALLSGAMGQRLGHPAQGGL